MSKIDIEDRKHKALKLYKNFYRFFNRDFNVIFLQDTIHIKTKDYTNEIELSHSQSIVEFEAVLQKQMKAKNEILEV